jgi:multiple sugar transport system permease protein
MAQTPAIARTGIGARLWQSRYDYLFLLPGLIIFGMFIGYPLVASEYFSLLQWSGFDADQLFVGFANYAELLSDSFFWAAFWRSFEFMLGTVPLQMVLSLILALILNNKLVKLSTLFRTLIFLPVVTPVAVIGIVMSLMLSPFNGPVNSILMNLHLSLGPIDFLGAPDIVLPTLMGIYVWKWTGVTLVYWLAALQTVPDELYEAARLDGVKGWQMTLHVIMPMIMPFAVVIALISAIGSMNVFPLIQSMTQGGPFFASEVMEVYIFRNAFASIGGAAPRLGYASAAGVFFGVAIMALTILQIVAVRQLRTREASRGR